MLPLFTLLVWPLAAFGGTSAATAVPFELTCILCALLIRPRLGGNLDRTLLVLVAFIALQILPLPGPVLASVSPHAGDVRKALSIEGLEPGALLPVSISMPATAWAWTVTAGTAALFWIARAQFSRGGVRQTVRLVAALGFAVSLLAIAQAATAGRDIYWRFRTEFEGPLPFGPFINRNHFATWTIMALPLCFGYIAARAGVHKEQPAHAAARARLVQLIDPRTAWLTAAGATMVLALLLSLSRSGALALGLSAALTVLLSRRRLDRRRRRGVLTIAAVVVLLGLAWADIPGLQKRLAGAPTGVTNRMAVWRETTPLVRDFWLTGTGAGTYQLAMLVYQRSERTVYFNQAHNHYLQLAAEGGLLLAGVVGFALAAFLRTARQRLTEDVSGLFWIRIGAACGLGAVALQSVWETGLVMPANAGLAAVLAAILVHDRDRETLNSER